MTTRQAPFRTAGTLVYCAIDQEHQVRGLVSLAGGGHGDGTYSDEQCQSMLAELQDGDIEVTWRRPAPLDVLAVEPGTGRTRP